jgi:alcohol dehydrogenase class IV
MALASCYAGLAFTKANLGYVHAIAHSLGTMYQIPHGLANGIVLPYILEYSRDAVTDRLAQLAVAIDLGTTDLGEDKLSERFIDRVKQLCKELNIPDKVEQLNKADIGSIAKDALKEAHYLYPVPKYMDQRQCTAILTRMLP